ncbi:MAG: FMN-binding protein [Deltaproteobacteria bacterium]|nr:FMN-binding protein [Deltaproteobacteria bacterium]
MSDQLRSILFAAATCLVCTISLTAASTGLKGLQQKNIAMDRQKNILKSVGLIHDNVGYTHEEINKLYTDNIKYIWVDSQGSIINKDQKAPKKLPVYIYMKNDRIESYILPIDSMGLWGRILGYLALKNDGSTIAGFTVYKHSETPGLGGEIEKRWFQKNFEGKKIVNRKGNFLSISIAKGGIGDTVADDRRMNVVDGISGATLTGKYLSTGLRNILLEYEPVSLKFRTKKLLRLTTGQTSRPHRKEK